MLRHLLTHHVHLRLEQHKLLLLAFDSEAHRAPFLREPLELLVDVHETTATAPVQLAFRSLANCFCMALVPTARSATSSPSASSLSMYETNPMRYWCACSQMPNILSAPSDSAYFGSGSSSSGS